MASNQSIVPAAVQYQQPPSTRSALPREELTKLMKQFLIKEYF